MSGYRPDGWDYELSKRLPMTCSDPDVQEAFEAGADAMLKVLRSQTHQDYLATKTGKSVKGKWIFIPD